MKNIVVIGGGAAGFFCAINAAASLQQKASVTLLEKDSHLLRKVSVSGGGRCNVTHACFDNSILVTKYPRGGKQLRGAFSRFTTTDTIEWFESHGIKLKVEQDGRMFPESNSSQTIINCLLDEAARNKVEVLTKVSAEKVVQKDSRFLISLSNGNIILADALVLAMGGLPKGPIIDWLVDSGHQITPMVPSLFTFNVADKTLGELMGNTVAQAEVKIEGTNFKETGPLLITHWGFSGPCILRLSAWAARELKAVNYHFHIYINWIEAFSDSELKQILSSNKQNAGKQKVINFRLEGLTNKLWQYLVKRAGIAEHTTWAEITKEMQQNLLEILLKDKYLIHGKTTFKEEFVTCGGVALDDINFKTMESKKIKGVYFAGEMIDVDGITGGFNFQNAWTTGWLAAQAIAEQIIHS